MNEQHSYHLRSNYIYSVQLSFIPAIVLFFIYMLTYLGSNYFFISNSFYYFLIFSTLFIYINLQSYKLLRRLMQFEIYWRSTLLTNVFLVGFILTHQSSYDGLVSFGYYLMSLSFFHLSEFVFTVLFNQKEVSTDSFLLNHSKAYGIAAVSSWLEYFIELLIFPSMKKSLYTRVIGLCLIIFGEFFRKLAMYTAGTNFNHYVQETKQSDHVLVTSGVYRLVRHPSYFGWFYWSIGTQILLANVICAPLYAFVSYKFFQNRIIFEEYYLLRFFGKQYKDYQDKVASGIPFVKGFVQVEENLD